jgi:hypothetical protein
MPDNVPEEGDVEARAREYGWKSPEEWKGDPPKGGFLDAEAFLRKSETLVPIVQSQNRELKEKLGKVETELQTVRQAAEQFQQFTQRALEKERLENQRLVQELESRRAQAISEGDGATAVEAERQIAALKATQPPPQPPQPPPEAAALVNAWRMENGWYDSDPELRRWADGYANELRAEGYPAGKAILNEVGRAVRAAFPDRVNGRPGAVEGKGRRAGESYGKKTFDDLPDEAKKAFEDFRKVMPKYSKADYLANYDWSQDG